MTDNLAKLVNDPVAFAEACTVDGKPFVLLPWQKRMLAAFASGDAVLIPHVRGGGRFFDALCAEYEKFTRRERDV